jgi:hypothetical protein
MSPFPAGPYTLIMKEGSETAEEASMKIKRQIIEIDEEKCTGAGYAPRPAPKGL